MTGDSFYKQLRTLLENHILVQTNKIFIDKDCRSDDNLTIPKNKSPLNIFLQYRDSGEGYCPRLRIEATISSITNKLSLINEIGGGAEERKTKYSFVDLYTVDLVFYSESVKIPQPVFMDYVMDFVRGIKISLTVNGKASNKKVKGGDDLGYIKATPVTSGSFISEQATIIFTARTSIFFEYNSYQIIDSIYNKVDEVIGDIKVYEDKNNIV